MAFPILAAVSPRSVLFTTPDGKTHSVPDAHPRFAAIAALVRMADAARREGDEAAAAVVTRLLPRLAGIAAMPPRADTQDLGPVQVREGAVRLEEESVTGAIAERILWSVREGLDARPLMAFLANLMENPSKRPVEDLFDYVDGRGLAITEDGHIVGYERVRADFRDIRSGTSDNSPGSIVEVRRNRVEEDPSRPCAVSLRFGPFPHYEIASGLGDDRIVAVKVHPRDVVAVPTIGLDGVRCCRYEVLFECKPAQDATMPNGPVLRGGGAFADASARPARAARVANAATEAPSRKPELEPIPLTADMMVPEAASPGQPIGQVAVASLKAAAGLAASDPAAGDVRVDSFVFGPDRPRSAAAPDPVAPQEPQAGTAAMAAEPKQTPRKRLPWPLLNSPAGVMGG